MPQTPIECLEEGFARAERAFLAGQPITAAEDIRAACDVVFASKTQAYREVLIGCLLTRITDPSRNIRLPYVDLAPDAYSGRQLDERVVNPFLHAKKVPCSRGPFLSVFRRQVRFDSGTRAGLRDARGYDAFLLLVGWIERGQDPQALVALLDYLLHRFVLLREEAKVQLVRLPRIGLPQCAELVRGLLDTPSGGVLPAALVRAVVETVAGTFSLPWQVLSQGINVADRASGAGGDVTVVENGAPLLTIEVTERPLDAARVQATFSDKIAPGVPSDYVFMVHLDRVEEDAREQAAKYFTHGYDVNVVDIRDWVVNTLVTVGSKGRGIFQERMLAILSDEQVPKALKLAWNEQIGRLTL